MKLFPRRRSSEPEQQGRDRRRRARRQVLWSAKLGFAGRNYDVQVWNVSLLGAKLKSAPPFGPGSEVMLEIARFGAFPATVVWRSGDAVGLNFVAPDEVAAAFGESVQTLGLDKPVRPDE